MIGMTRFELKRRCDPYKMREIAESKNMTPEEIKLLEYKFCKAYSNARLQATFYYLGSRTSIWRAWTAAKEKFES